MSLRTVIGSTTSAGAPSYQTYEVQAAEWKMFNAGVVNKTGGDFAVTQRGAGANMSVDVAAGAALVSITNTNLDSAVYPVWFLNNATVNVIISAADPTNARKDIIVAKVDVSQNPDASAGNISSIIVVTGTPSGAPVAPAVPANCLQLAEIAVGISVVTIVTANITDKRTAIAVKTNVLPGLALEQEAQDIRDNKPFIAATTGSANAYLLTPGANSPTAYVTGQKFEGIANFTNTAAATLNVAGLGAKTMKKVTVLGGITDLVSGDIQNGQAFSCRYDGTYMQVLNIAVSAGSTNFIKVSKSTSQAQAVDTVTNAAETAFATKYTAGANYLAASGNKWNLLARGASSATGSATTFQIRVKWGSTTIAPFNPTPPSSQDGKWELTCEVEAMTASASGILFVKATLYFEKSGTTKYEYYNWRLPDTSGGISFDTTAASQDITITTLWNNGAQRADLTSYFLTVSSATAS